MAMAICFVLSASAINPYAYLVSFEQQGLSVDLTYKLNAAASAAELQFIANDAVVASVPLTGLTAGEHNEVVAMPNTLTPFATYKLALAVTCAAHDFEVYRDASLTVDNRMHGFVNNVPTSPEFGNTYLAARTQTAGTGRCYYKVSPEYVINSTKWNPYTTSSVGRGTMADNGLVFFAEYGDANSGIWVYNPEDGTTHQFFQGTRNGLGLFVGDDSAEQGCSTPGIGIYSAGADSKLYMVGEDFGNSDKVPFHLAIYNIGRQDGSIVTTWDEAPSKLIRLSDANGGNFGVAPTKYGAWLCQNRAKNQNIVGARSLMFYTNDGIRKFVSNPATIDTVNVVNGSLGGGVLYDDNNEKLYITNGDGNLVEFSVSWNLVDTTPSLTLDTIYTLTTKSIGQMSFDYAHNIVATTGINGYASSTANMAFTVFSLPSAAPETVVTPVQGVVSYADVNQLYTIGSNQEGGWAPNVGTALTKVSDNVFKYETFISNETYLVFVTDLADNASDWDFVNARRFGATENDFVIANGDNVNLVKGAGNNSFKISTPGNYIITVDFNTMKVSVVSYPKVSIAGTFPGADAWSTNLYIMDEAVDHLSASKTIHLDAGWYQFKVVLNDAEWLSTGETDQIDRRYNTKDNLATNHGNYSFLVDIAGDYEFVFTYANKGLEITFPDFVRAAANTNYQSLCTPFDATVVGATAYELVSADASAVNVRSVDELVAGHSYLLKPDAIGDIAINYVADGAITLTPVNPDANGTGLYGELKNTWTYQYDDPEQANWRNFFVLLDDDMFHQVRAGGEVTITPTRAYLRIAGDEIVDPTPAPIRIIENATNIQNIEGQEKAVKFIENGQMFIKKNGVVYDAMGRVIR